MLTALKAARLAAAEEICTLERVVLTFSILQRQHPAAAPATMKKNCLGKQDTAATQHTHLAGWSAAAAAAAGPRVVPASG
jgi:hypothetical protein